MKSKPIVFLFLVGICALTTFGQTVVISPKKTIYRRPKPQHEHKKTFTIRRPIVKAANAALSRKITAAISPETVLDLKVRDELTEYQWLEEADYKVLFNQRGVLCVEQWMVGTAAYPDSVTRRVVVDVATGMVVRPADVFADLPRLAVMVKNTQSAEIEAATAEMKSEPDARPEELFREANFTAADFKEFSVDTKGVTFYYDYGFPHVLEAFEPKGEFHFTWAQLKPFVQKGRLLAGFVR